MSDIITPSAPRPENNQQNTPSGDSFRDLNFLSLKGYFNVELPTVDQEDDLNFIYKYFEESGAKDMADILLNIKAVERKLGAAPLGTSRVSAVKNYLKIQKQIDDLTKQKSAYES